MYTIFDYFDNQVLNKNDMDIIKKKCKYKLYYELYDQNLIDNNDLEKGAYYYKGQGLKYRFNTGIFLNNINLYKNILNIKIKENIMYLWLNTDIWPEFLYTLLTGLDKIENVKNILLIPLETLYKLNLNIDNIEQHLFFVFHKAPKFSSFYHNQRQFYQSHLLKRNLYINHIWYGICFIGM